MSFYTMAAACAVAMLGAASQAAPISGTWVITSGQADADVVAGTENTSSPQLAPQAPSTDVAGTTLESAFPSKTLTNPGDYVQVSGSFNLVRAGTAANLTSLSRLNDQLRVGLFGAPAPPTEGATGAPRGFIAEYGSAAIGADGEIRGLIGTQANPFSGGANTPIIALAGDDLEGNGISGTPAAVNFTFRITRQAGNTVDLTGRFTGITVDPLDNDYLQAFSVLGHSPDPSFNYTLNRAAFLIGGNSDAASGGLFNVQVLTNIPEPATCGLGLASLLGCMLSRRRTMRIG